MNTDALAPMTPKRIPDYDKLSREELIREIEALHEAFRRNFAGVAKLQTLLCDPKRWRPKWPGRSVYDNLVEHVETLEEKLEAIVEAVKSAAVEI